MKRWTQHDARTDHLVEADQFNRQHRATRGSIAGLDRSQYPSGCVTDAMLTDAARHKVWVYAPWPADPAHTFSEGEQGRLVRGACMSATSVLQRRLVQAHISLP